MKMKIFYQDFYLNDSVLEKNKLVLNFRDAVLIREIDSTEAATVLSFPEESIEKKDMARAAMRIMNDLDIPEYHPDRQLFEKVRHTSMSVGDFVMFEDNEIWMVWLFGWEVFPPKKLSKSLQSAIKNAFQNQDEAQDFITQLEIGANKLTPCDYPMNKFYNYKEEVPKGTRVSEAIDCLSCGEKDCDEQHCLISEPVQDEVCPKKDEKE